MKTFDLFGDFVDAFLFRNVYASSKKADDVDGTNKKSAVEEKSSTEEKEPVNRNLFMTFSDFFDLFPSFGNVVAAESVKQKEYPVEEKETKEYAHEEDLPEENEVKENEQEKVQEASDSAGGILNESEESDFVVLDENGMRFNFKIPEEFDNTAMFNMQFDMTDFSLVIRIKKFSENKEINYEIRKKLDADENPYHSLYGSSSVNLQPCITIPRHKLDASFFMGNFDMTHIHYSFSPETHILSVVFPHNKDRELFGY